MRAFFRFSFLLVDAALVVLFLIGYAAAYLRPDVYWWAAQLGSALPYTTLLLLGAGLGVAVLRRPVLAGVHAVLLVLALVRFVPSGVFRPAPQPGPGDLTVMTFNVGGADEVRPGDAAYAPEAVRRVRPDLIALQEVGAQYRGPRPGGLVFPLTVLIDSFGYRIPPRADERRKQPLWSPVLARIPTHPYEQARLGASAEEDHTLLLTRVPFTWQGREAVIYNLHLRSFAPARPWRPLRRVFSWAAWASYFKSLRAVYRTRAREAEQVGALLAQERLPVIVCGDFNSTAHNWEYRTIAAGLRNAFTERGREWGATYHLKLPLVRIDHVLVSPEWEVVSAHVPGVPPPFDHRPLVARLRWRE